MNIIINATQHSATPDQIAAGVYPSAYEEKIRQWLTFDSLPSRLTIQQHAQFIAGYVADQAMEIVKNGDFEEKHHKALQQLVGMPAYRDTICKSFHIKAMIGGAPYLMAELEKELWHLGIEPVYAFTKRESVESVDENGNVSKTAVFKHAGFVSAIQ